MQDLFKQMDMDNNGLIDWEEFVAYFGSAAKEKVMNIPLKMDIHF